MGRRIKEHEDVVHARSLLEQVTVILDAAGLNEIAVHADYAKQLLDINMLTTPQVVKLPVFGAETTEKKEL